MFKLLFEFAWRSWSVENLNITYIQHVFFKSKEYVIFFYILKYKGLYLVILKLRVLQVFSKICGVSKNHGAGRAIIYFLTPIYV